MKKKFHLLSILLLLSISFSALCQSSEDQNCTYVTDGTGNTHGRKVQVEYPCAYVPQEPTSQNAAKKFSYNKGQIVILLQVIKHPQDFSDNKIKSMMENDILKDAFNQLGKVLNIKATTINGLQATEVEWKASSTGANGEFFTSYLTYFISLGREQIQLYYGVHDADENKSLKMLKEHKDLFRKLASNTKLLN